MPSFSWLAVLVVALVVEGATAGLLSIWFAFGALAAYLTALLGLPFVWQAVVFFAVSALALWLTRPFAKKLRAQTKPTNADRLIGEKAMVVTAIDSIENVGAVKVLGQIWSASSFDKTPIPENTQVTVCEIQGVRLVVRPVGTDEN